MPDLLFKPCSMVSCTTAAKNKHFGPFNSKRRLPCFIYFLPICAIVLALQGCRQSSPATWPTIERETRPWSRWWWHGSALTPEGITAEMEAYQKAGIGGLEITPIYGVYGDENNFVDYLSPRWMELLMHTLREAARLDMGIDMATGTGWPFGGPWVSDDDACKNFEYRIYALREGQSLNEAVEFKQQPYLRAVGNLIYNRYNRAFFHAGKTPSDGSAMRVDPKQIDIQKILQPVSANNNLQALALDQVKFERMLDLKALMAYSDRGETIDLFDKVDANNKLRWTAPQGNWKLYAVFEGWHGKMVERAGPGGEGNVIDHFSSQALKQYLNRFDSAFRRNDITSLRAFFNDSYEVDDARGAADWTPELFSIFQKNRGYDLRHHIPAWLGQDAAEKNERVLSDYRQTISELVHDNFTLPWKSWAHRNGAIIRNQAHGAPANILDLYAAVDIPEIEGIEPLRIKMASSAGNIAGKKLVSSESATWLDEHFKSNLGDIKVAADRFMLHGVNHIFYHGTCYSPPNDPWPGRLFYAAVHLNPRNPMWRDFDALNEYVTRCQSLLQRSRADQDILVYFPIHDRFATPGAEMLEHFDGVGKQFENTAFREASEHMLEKGFAFDFISDQQVLNTRCDNGRLKTEGGNSYKVILIPHSRYIPVETLEQIVTLAKEGATVIFYRGLPESFAGYANLDANRKKFNDLIATLPASGALQTGKGKIFSGTDLAKLLEQSGVRREAMTDLGIQYLRKITPEGEREYFISNGSNDQFTGWIPLGTPASSVTILDPVSGRIGSGNTRTVNGITEVFVSLSSRQSMFIRSTKRDTPEKFNFYKPVGEPVALRGPWSVTFTEGGPVLPESLEIDTLTSWTMFPQDACQAFSGTAAYTITFNKPQQKSSWWLLDLGRVNESAEVLLNGKPVATLIGPTYRVMIDDRQMKPDNILEIRVSNLMANRIADLDKRQVFWKKFYNVNFPARMAENRVDGLFNAAHWAPEDSGLVGPVTISATGVAED